MLVNWVKQSPKQKVQQKQIAANLIVQSALSVINKSND